MKRKVKMNDKFTKDDIIAALCQKFGNSTLIIDGILDKNIHLSDNEKEKILNEIHEDYISVLSDKYPIALASLDDPPVCLFHSGDLDVFQKDIHLYASKVNQTDMAFIGAVDKGDEVEWCIATTDQEDLQPFVEEVFERLQNFNLKDYTQTKNMVLN